MSSMEITINLDMLLRVMQHVLYTWDEIGAVVRELQKLGWAHLMMTGQISVSTTYFSICELMAAGCVCSY